MRNENFRTLKQLRPEAISKDQWNKVVDSVTLVIQDSLKKGIGVQLPGIGSFKILDKPARECMNFRTKRKMISPAHKAVKFSTSATLKAMVKE